MADAGCTHVFMEASSHAIVQSRMAGTQFAGAVFTNITHDHLDYHGDFNSYIRAKKQLFDMLPSNAFAAVNADDAHAEDMVEHTKAKVVTMAVQGVADERARLIENQISGLVSAPRWSRAVFPTRRWVQCKQSPGRVRGDQAAGDRQDERPDANVSVEATRWPLRTSACARWHHCHCRLCPHPGRIGQRAQTAFPTFAPVAST